MTVTCPECWGLGTKPRATTMDLGKICKACDGEGRVLIEPARYEGALQRFVEAFQRPKIAKGMM